MCISNNQKSICHLVCTVLVIPLSKCAKHHVRYTRTAIARFSDVLSVVPLEMGFDPGHSVHQHLHHASAAPGRSRIDHNLTRDVMESGWSRLLHSRQRHDRVTTGRRPNVLFLTLGVTVPNHVWCGH